jgi:hypothetical protein
MTDFPAVSRKNCWKKKLLEKKNQNYGRSVMTDFPAVSCVGRRLSLIKNIINYLYIFFRFGGGKEIVPDTTIL